MGQALATEPAQEASVSLSDPAGLAKCAVTARVVPQDTLFKVGKQILQHSDGSDDAVKPTTTLLEQGRAGSLLPERRDITFHGCISDSGGDKNFML